MRGAAIDAVINFGLVLVLLNFRSVGQSEIAGIAVDNNIILTDELFGNIDVMDIGCGGFNRVNHTGTSIHANISLHFEIPMVPLLSLAHLRVALLLLVLRRTGRNDDGGINDGAATVHEASLFKTGIQFCKELFAYMVVLKELTEMLKGRRIRNLLFTKVDTYEFTESVDVINDIAPYPICRTEKQSV